ncbi:hypothetical protein VYU27_001155 [Nannochloropsis oceanica]
MTRRRRGIGSSSWRPGYFSSIAVFSNLCLLGFLLSTILPSVAARRSRSSSSGVSTSLTTTMASQQRSTALEVEAAAAAAAAAAAEASAPQLRPIAEGQLLHPFLALTTRGGASQSSSLMGRILRAWRGSAKNGGSIYGRMKRFLGALWNGKRSGASNCNTGGRSNIRSAGGAGRGAGGMGRKLGKSSRAEKHLGTEFRRGNANFRIQKELREWLANPMDNMHVAVGDNLRVWVVTLTGAKGTVFAGEKYKLKFTFPVDYPSKPPSVYFLQPTPRHEHVYTNGDICLNLLGRDWRPNMTASMLALSILSMLSSAKEKKIPQDNHVHADNPPGREQANWLYHDDKC